MIEKRLRQTEENTDRKTVEQKIIELHRYLDVRGQRDAQNERKI